MSKSSIWKDFKIRLLELSRQTKAFLRETSQAMGHLDEGIGRTRDIKSMSLAILRRIEEESLKANTSKVVAELPIKISTYLMNEKRKKLIIEKQC